MSETRIGFKVVRKDDRVENGYYSNEYRSATCCGAEFVYNLQKKTERIYRCGPIAVFDSLENAKGFINETLIPGDWDDYYILLIEYEPSKERILWYTSIYTNFIHKRVGAFPSGTDFAEWVRPLHMLNDLDINQPKHNLDDRSLISLEQVL